MFTFLLLYLYPIKIQMVNLRKLRKGDSVEGYCDVLSCLTSVGSFSQAEFDAQLCKIEQCGGHIWILEDAGRIIGTGTLLVEPKFIHSCGNAGHIEDVVIHRDYQGKGYGRLLIEQLLTCAKDMGCYKVILDCREHVEAFYEKMGFEKRGLQMAKYW